MALNNTNALFFSFVAQKSNMSLHCVQIKVLAKVCFFLETNGETSISFPFPAREASCIPCLQALFCLQSQGVASFSDPGSYFPLWSQPLRLLPFLSTHGIRLNPDRESRIGLQPKVHTHYHFYKVPFVM